MIQDASLDNGLSLLDKQLGRRVHEAFAAHPWVEKVVEVRKSYPARIDVELVYRRPVAMVDVVVDGSEGYMPVDVEGIYLPVEDFSLNEASRYPPITGVDSLPTVVGRRWEDPRVLGAAKLAKLLGDDWQKLNLREIVPSAVPPGPGGADEITYTLYTRRDNRRGVRVLWGRGPGSSIPGEMSSEEKLARLLKFAERYGALDSEPDQLSASYDLDLRGQGQIRRVPRTASRDERRQPN